MRQRKILMVHLQALEAQLKRLAPNQDMVRTKIEKRITEIKDILKNEERAKANAKRGS